MEEKLKLTEKAQILLVDDNEFCREVFGMYLSTCHLLVDTAGNGYDAIFKCQEKKYNLIFMDDFMPVLNGLASAAIIRSRENSRNADTKIIVWSVVEEEQLLRQDILYDSFDYYLKKVSVGRSADILEKFYRRGKDKIQELDSTFELGDMENYRLLVRNIEEDAVLIEEWDLEQAARETELACALKNVLSLQKHHRELRDCYGKCLSYFERSCSDAISEKHHLYMELKGELTDGKRERAKLKLNELLPGENLSHKERQEFEKLLCKLKAAVEMEDYRTAQLFLNELMKKERGYDE